MGLLYFIVAWLGMYTGEANVLLFAVLGEMMLYMLSFLRGERCCCMFSFGMYFLLPS